MEILGQDIVCRIDEVLHSKGLTRKYIAEEIRTSSQWFNNLINQNSMPSADKIYKISVLLNVSMAWILTGKEEENDLTIEEKKLIEKYRILDERDRIAVQNLADTLSVRYQSGHAEPADQSERTG